MQDSPKAQLVSNKMQTVTKGKKGKKEKIGLWHSGVFFILKYAYLFLDFWKNPSYTELENTKKEANIMT